MTSPFKHRFLLGGRATSRIGLGSSYGLGTDGVLAAVDRGINFLFWGLRRRAGFGKAIRQLGSSRRDDVTVAVQSYSRMASLVGPSVETALCRAKLDAFDLLVLGWWNGTPPERLRDAALKLKEAGKVKAIGISCHHRPTFEQFIADPTYDLIMLRYNAAHVGAESEVFPHLEKRRPTVLAFTATRWGSLMNPKHVPAGEQVPTASDCYRFALSNSNVDACLAGPKNEAELQGALDAVERGPMSPDELAWMRRVGVAVRAAKGGTRRVNPVKWADQMSGVTLEDKAEEEPPR